MTDFGLRDPYVGIMKGVLLGIAPGTCIVDLSHDVPPQDIRQGAFALAAAVRWFPEGTIHVAVVDPGVGTERKALLIETSRSVLLLPDNGLATLALEQEPAVTVWCLDREEFFLSDVSRTFHGRDVFASVAGHLASGRRADEMGTSMDRLRIVEFESPPPSLQGDRLLGEVLYIDRFGNLVTSILQRHTGGRRIDRAEVGHAVAPFATSYQAVSSGTLLSIWGGFGYLEVSLNMGSAAEYLRARVGSPIRVNFSEPS